MRKSTNFNLNLVEGNDLVNPLVQDVPNYEAIDEQMYKNECNSIGIATELKSGTVHALTRTIPNAPMFRFKATSNFTAGDTFTVDGIQVSALTPNGETLASNSYIIGSEVLCVLRETLLTVYVSGGVVITAQDSEKLGGQLPEYYGTAENVSTALLTAQSANQLTLNLQQEVNNINSNLTASDELQFRFATDGEGNYGYLGADDSFIPFRSGGLKAYCPLGWNGDDPYARYYKRILGGIIYDNSVADFSSFTNSVPMQITIKSKGSYTFAISCQSWGSAISHGYGLYVNGIDKGTVSTATNDPLVNIITLDLNVGDIVKLKVSSVGSYTISADLFMIKN